MRIGLSEEHRGGASHGNGHERWGWGTSDVLGGTM